MQRTWLAVTDIGGRTTWVPYEAIVSLSVAEAGTGFDVPVCFLSLADGSDIHLAGTPDEVAAAVLLQVEALGDTVGMIHWPAP